MNDNILINLKKELVIRGYTNETVKAYLFWNEQFLSWIKKDIKSINQADIKNYLYHLKKKRLKNSSVNLALASVRFLFTKYLKRQFKDLKSLKKQEKHTGVLNRELILDVINNETNLKHKFLLITFYSTGARLSEVLNIRLDDVDLIEKEIIIRQGKGQRDRAVEISDMFIRLFYSYIEIYQPKTYLFEARKSRYSDRSAQKIIDKMFVNHSDKHVHPHMLRASFATHLVEKGVDTKIIQFYTGHKSLKSLSPYLHYANFKKNRISNPLDDDF